ncbi:substrate-binding domain-containing protein [Amaricoccus solimangrovi]|uniref:Substrate-binding domain-containing protein n=1 Tax=Amaricoccus solimangrovi TaxID=2589815 RepID=A0A501W7X4_9RHOB|nr:substrate-binding domain-containing protein [Amaricoccus solimangrovi]
MCRWRSRQADAAGPEHAVARHRRAGDRARRYRRGATLIDEARREGVKTIVYDIGVTATNPDWMITRNQELVGKLQVEAAKKFAPKGNYAVLKGDPANDLAQTSDRSYAAGLTGAEGINVVYNDFIAGYDPAKAQSEAEAILTRNDDDVAAFVVNNDGMAGGVVQALRGAGLNGKVFVSGLDADQANLNLIALGDQTMTVFTPIDVMAKRAADAAHQLGNGGTPESNSVATTDKGDVPLWQLDLVAVTKDNLCEFVEKIAPKGWVDPAAVVAGSDVKCE